MLKLTLLAIGLGASAETPKTTPAPAPFSVPLSETDQLKVENIQLRLQLTKASEAELNTALTAIFAKACQSIGGASMADCNAMGPNGAQPGYSVSLKPVAAKNTPQRETANSIIEAMPPVVAKKEEPKK